MSDGEKSDGEKTRSVRYHIISGRFSERRSHRPGLGSQALAPVAGSSIFLVTVDDRAAATRRPGSSAARPALRPARRCRSRVFAPRRRRARGRPAARETDPPARSVTAPPRARGGRDRAPPRVPVRKASGRVVGIIAPSGSHRPPAPRPSPRPGPSPLARPPPPGAPPPPASASRATASAPSRAPPNPPPNPRRPPPRTTRLPAAATTRGPALPPRKPPRKPRSLRLPRLPRVPPHPPPPPPPPRISSSPSTSRRRSSPASWI